MSTSGAGALARRPHVAVVGAGTTGVRTARALLVPDAGGTVPVGTVTLVTRRTARRAQLRASFGSSASVVCDGGAVDAVGDAAVVVVAREAGAQLEVVRAQLDAGRHVVATTDDPDEVTALLALSERAAARGVVLVVGAAMSPGLSCLLAAHGASLLDRVDEVHVARHGVGGPACARQRLRALRGSGTDWRDGAWVERPGFSGRELNWFPDPVGALDCYRAELAEPQVLRPSFPGASRITARLAATRRDRALAPFPVLFPPPEDGGLGAVRVELRGSVGEGRHSVVYGSIDRPSVAAAGVAAVVALSIAGGALDAGATGVAGLGGSRDMLAELARRGIRCATFEGAASTPDEPREPDTTQSAQVRARAADVPHEE